MKVKKIFFIIAIFIILGASELSASFFKECVLTPKLGTSMTIPTNATVHPTFKGFHLGPSLDFDAKFNHNSGFSFLITVPIYSIINPNAQAPTPHFLLEPFLNLLVGYTYGVGKNFQFTLAAGIGLTFFAHLAIPVQADFSYYFTKKYGIAASITNIIAISFPNKHEVKPMTRLTDFLEISIGANFRL